MTHVTNPPDDRVDPPMVADERTLLEGFLDYHRATLRWKVSGLSDEALKTRSVEPSSLSLLGLVRHMAEVERGWFRNAMAGESLDPIFYTRAEPDGDFDLLDDAVVADDLATWQAEIDASRRIAAERGLDHVGRRHNGDEVSLRWVFHHMLEEYARHNGHADLIRERIDGAVGE